MKHLYIHYGTLDIFSNPNYWFSNFVMLKQFSQQNGEALPFSSKIGKIGWKKLEYKN